MESGFSIFVFALVLTAFSFLLVRFVQIQKRKRQELQSAEPEEREVSPEPESGEEKEQVVSPEPESREKAEKPESKSAEAIKDAPAPAPADEPSPIPEVRPILTPDAPVAAPMDENAETIPMERKAEAKEKEQEPAEEVATAAPEPAQKAAEPKREDAARPAPEPAQEAAKPEPVEAEREKSLREGLEKTRGGFISRLGKLFSLKKEIDESILDELEEVLFTADIGPATASRLFEAIKDRLSRKQLANADAVWKALREISMEILDLPAPPLDFSRGKPFVILVAGVNGVGKTTTIGKLASQYKAQGHKVLLAAADTFRAAAIDQLAVWAERAGCEIVRKPEGADPSSVVFDAVRKARDEGYDIVIADTAGRLHTQVGLMEELGKVRRTAAKACEGAPHESFLVLDATTGQNALAQAEMFMKTIDFTGIVITKLDGTAKGGIILGICDRMKVPVRYIGIGEKIHDLRPFDARKFVEALFSSEP